MDSEASLRDKEGGYFGKSTFWRLVVDSDNNLTIPHMDMQLAKNILDLKPEEIEFVLKDLIEPVFIEQTKKRLEKLQIAIHKELNNPKSKVFLDEGQWDQNSLEDFLSTGRRRKMDAELPDKFKSKAFYITKKYDTIDKLVELNKNDNYISQMVDALMGYKAENGFYMS